MSLEERTDGSLGLGSRDCLANCVDVHLNPNGGKRRRRSRRRATIKQFWYEVSPGKTNGRNLVGECLARYSYGLGAVPFWWFLPVEAHVIHVDYGLRITEERAHTLSLRIRTVRENGKRERENAAGEKGKTAGALYRSVGRDNLHGDLGGCFRLDMQGLAHFVVDARTSGPIREGTVGSSYLLSLGLSILVTFLDGFTFVLSIICIINSN